MNYHDIARESGVSIATVSRVLNSPHLVRDETRRRVLHVMKNHNYTPNALARGLLHNRTLTIGVLTTDILNPYYATVVQSIEKTLTSYSYNTLLCNTGTDAKQKARYIRALLERRVDGLVFVGSIYQEKEGAGDIIAASRTVPVVMINSVIRSPNIYSVFCDDGMGIQKAVAYLIEASRRRIVFINASGTPSSRMKERAFRGFLEEGLISPDSCRIIETSTETLGELPILLRSVLTEQAYDAILASDDLFANVVVNTLHGMHVPIPEAMWVVGYNNSYLSDQTFPRLTSIDSRMHEIGVCAVRTLMGILSQNAEPKRVLHLSPSLVVKDSTGTPAGDAPK